MKLRVRKIKEENKISNEKPSHLVNLKISENSKKNQIKKKENKNEKILFFLLKYTKIFQKLTFKIKNFLQNLELLKKIYDEFSQSKKILFYYSKIIVSFFKKNKPKKIYSTKTIKEIPQQNQHLKPFQAVRRNKILFEKLVRIKHFFYIFSQEFIKFENFYSKKIKIFFKKSAFFIKNQYYVVISMFSKKVMFFKKNTQKEYLHIPSKIFLKKEIPYSIKKARQTFEHHLHKNEKKILNWKLKIKNWIFSHRSILIFVLIAFLFLILLSVLFLMPKSKTTVKETKNIRELTNEINLSNFISIQSELKQITKELPASSKNRALFNAEKYLSLTEKYLISALGDEERKKEIPTERIADFQNNLLIALPKIQITNYYLAQVKIKTIPKQNRDEFNQIKIYLSKCENNIQEILDYSKNLLKILGNEKKQRYLVVLQNSDKIRPTGGSIEALILIDIEQGIVKKVAEQNFTFLQNNPIGLVKPPYPLQFIKPTWQTQDVNWFFDFPTSAKKILQVYKKFNTSKKIDGVISLNTNLISKFSAVVELDQTKNFITDLFPELLNKILSSQNNSEQSLKILEILNEALSKKDIMLYFNEQDLQENILKNDWAGEIKSAINKDYLAVVNAYIDGESNKNIKQSINLQTQILDDGTIIDTVKISRIFLENSGFGKNLDYVKIYVPKGSIILEVDGFAKTPLFMSETSPKEISVDKDLLKIQKQILVDEITNTRIAQEFDKTVFSNLIEVEPGKSSTITFKYKLPFKLEDLKTDKKQSGFFDKFMKKFNLIDETLSYQLLIQKQSGSKDDVWKYSINLPIDWKLIWQNIPDDFIEINNQIQFNSFLDRDQPWAFLLKKIK